MLNTVLAMAKMNTAASCELVRRQITQQCLHGALEILGLFSPGIILAAGAVPASVTFFSCSVKVRSCPVDFAILVSAIIARPLSSSFSLSCDKRYLLVYARRTASSSS